MKKQLARTLVWAAALAVMLMASTAWASDTGDSISIKLGADQPGSTLAPTADAGVPSVTSMNWNNAFNESGTLGSLVRDIQGAATTTTASVTWNGTNTWASTLGSNDNFGGDDFTLMNGYLDQNTVPFTITVQVSNLPDDMAAGYDVYVYFLGDNAHRGGVYTVNGVAKFGFVGTEDSGPNYVDAGQIVPPAKGNYLVFQNLTGNTVSISADNDIGFRAPINAVEIVNTSQQ